MKSFSFSSRSYVASSLVDFSGSSAGEILREKRKKERDLSRGDINCRRGGTFSWFKSARVTRGARDFASSRARQSSEGAELVRRAIFLRAERSAHDDSSGYAVDAYIFGHIALLKLRCICERCTQPCYIFPWSNVTHGWCFPRDLSRALLPDIFSLCSVKEKHLTFSLVE